MKRSTSKSKISYKPWGKHNEQEVYLFKMENAKGSFVELTNYGAALVSIAVPDKENKLGNVILGFPALEGYLNDPCYIGATIGRFANRIGAAKFNLAGDTFYLEKNDGKHSNHGGTSGFNSKVFSFSVSGETLSFAISSKDGEGGYPGNLQLRVAYTWNNENELSIKYSAISDKTTIANFTNHAYFNLSAGKDNILSHVLSLKASKLLETNADYIPTGLIKAVADSAFHQHKIKERVTKEGNSIKGLNSYYIFDRARQRSDSASCNLFEPISGRQMEVWTSYPGVQLYTGDYLTSNALSTHSIYYKPFDGLCLECQHYPDAPNHANFPSTVMEEGQNYDEYITFKFSVRT